MPTTNPVPSSDPSDLLFNAQKLDETVNSASLTFTDRLGTPRKTMAGIQAAFDAQLADAESDLNVYRADAAASAAEALGYLQTYRATSYGALASDPATDPLGNPPTVGDEYFNTTANLLKRWNGTTWQASDINTANLAASSGSSLVGYDGGTVQDVLDGAKSLQDYAALRAYTGRATRIYITGLLATAKPVGIAGVFQHAPTDTISADNGGTIIVGADGRRWKRDYSGFVHAVWFGAMANGINDDSEPASRAIAYLFSINANTLFFGDGTFLFKNPVTILFNTYRSLKFVGTSSAGFVATRPGGTRITGDAGLTSLFIFTKTTLTAWGGYSFSTEGIDYNGNGFGVDSAFLNKVAGAPARPFNVNNCNFVGFKKAIFSDISATGLTTGISNINIHGSSFVGNQYALYGKGQSALANLNFTGNVCEQNTLGAIYTEAGAFVGTLNISDNLLEGQPNAITINAGKVSGSIKRNYFELNSQDIINFQTNIVSSKLEISNNYYQNSSGAKVNLSGGTFVVNDNFDKAGIYLGVVRSQPKSFFSNNGKIYPALWSATGGITACAAGTTSLGSNTPPATIDSSGYINFSSGFDATPAGYLNYATVSGAGPVQLTQTSVEAGDGIVAVCLARVVSGVPDVSFYVYTNASGSLSNTTAITLEPNCAARDEWFILTAYLKAPISSGGAARVRWLTTNGVIETTKTFVYRVATPVDGTTPVYMTMPYLSPLRGSATYDPPSLVDGAGATTTVTVTGAELGDFVESVSFSNDLQGVTVTGWVSAANIVSIRFQNETGGTVDLASGTIRAIVKKS